MTFKSAILAAVIGFATVTGAAAAPLGTPAPAAAPTVVEAGYHGHGYKKHHGHGHYGHGYHKKRVFYGRNCFVKKIKVWSDYYGHFVWKSRKVCHGPRFY